MEFNEKLQQLRKQRGLTQEQLAEALYVTRTAVSKWESGRGYPNIDSLKAIAGFFSLTVDELLSTDELLTIAEEDGKEKRRHLCDLVFGLIDLSAAMFLFLPFFGQKSDGEVQAVSLLALTQISPYLTFANYTAVIGIIVLGILTLCLQNCQKQLWVRYKDRLSLLFGIVGVILFTISLQPYAAIFLFVFLIIKLTMLLKNR